ncbi:phosphoribosylformylglycinamidine synthase II [Helicobacter sp. 16-1353]|uniref:phosphoribosylformylglycinamidine synthase subunit PurL n=1 Tax=Helicobacter sp. 16-1353 TaxID=2004996 RepID=UPI000DCB23EC|nr:phosphoribosylformylglycinamidine synthase subunit PurL [Helicobacter sp. 16-1353]RAX54742.1 phosphoribosylformylglycinamidine synthase II [Helicobacter sp. 16-1353]
MQNIQDVLKNHKLSVEDYENIKKILGRVPNIVEIGIFSAMWSEHCSYKSSKIYLRNFPTSAPYVVQGPGENAGIIDIGGGYCAVFKMESHNHPSFIEPYAGAATGVGGILRDIFTMGARPVASLDSIRFGDILDSKHAKKHKYLVRGVVAGIGDYGNCMGIPTIGGETSFESCYNGNILVNAFNLGIVKKENIFYGKAKGVGNPIIYVGSKTGRDGLGGAVMSSDSFNEESKNLRPTVQVGDPFSEKLLLEACLELFKKDLIIGIQDMGAAGLTSSSFEMASRAGSGMKMHLDKVPTREENMTPYELMLSESQERMLICAKNGKENEVIEIFNKWEIDVAVIGEVTDSGNMELFFNGEICANIPIAPLSDAAPVLHRPIEKPQYLDNLQNFTFIPSQKSQNEIFRELLGSPDICDKSWIYNQYDSTILTNTILGSGSGDASVIRVKENGKFLAMSLYCNPRYCYLDPREGGKIAVATAGRNCATRGAKPLSITDCLNFGSPDNPNVMWQFKEACEGIAEACEILQTPVVSGNVSLYNQSEQIDIYPTPSIGMVGIIDKIENLKDSALKQKGHILVVLGELREDFGGSLLLKISRNQIAGIPPKINLYKELALWKLLQESGEFIKSAKSVKEGGIAIALTKMALLGGFGIDVEMDISKDMIFSESQSCVCIEINENKLNRLNELSNKFSIPYKIIGKVTQKGANINIDSVAITQNEVRKLYFDTFSTLMNN